MLQCLVNNTACVVCLPASGACEGVCACSTCHIIFEDSDTFDELPESEEIEEVSE